jgi:hypothetical protein
VIYFKKRHDESRHNFLNIQASPTLSLVAASLRGLRNNTIYHYGFNTVNVRMPPYSGQLRSSRAAPETRGGYGSVATVSLRHTA